MVVRGDDDDRDEHAGTGCGGAECVEEPTVFAHDRWRTTVVPAVSRAESATRWGASWVRLCGGDRIDAVDARRYRYRTRPSRQGRP